MLPILLPGQYPRSESLVKASRLFDRKQITLSELEAEQKKDRSALLMLQSDFAYKTSGLFAWQDLMRPFEEIIEHAQAGTLIRFFETNLFWRELKCQGPWRIKESQMDLWIKKWFAETQIITLPFLYLFKNFAHEASLNDISTILKSVALKLSALPNKLICFFEPTIGYRALSSEERNLGMKLLESIKGHTKTPIFLSTAFFSIKEEQKFLYSLPVDGLGIDFYANSSEVLNNFPIDKTLAAGIIDTSTTAIETEKHWDSFINALPSKIEINRLYFMPSGVAELLPREIMDAKVEALKEWVACSCRP